MAERCSSKMTKTVSMYNSRQGEHRFDKIIAIQTMYSNRYTIKHGPGTMQTKIFKKIIYARQETITCQTNFILTSQLEKDGCSNEFKHQAGVSNPITYTTSLSRNRG